MAQSKALEFKQEEILLAEFAKALAHPARIAILKELAIRTECICGDLVEVLPLAQSTVSQHLKELQKIGLIQGEIDGPKSCYCINKKNMDKYMSILNKFFNHIESCC
ncbi:MAG TPA: metalloregulator ArsR/SmtB family transcription factor [bacterium]|nr:metalloregulator ArsR/SmtB family transcription factor [bacterium]